MPKYEMLPFLHETLRQYNNNLLAYPSALFEMILGSVLEASEELIRRSAECGFQEYFRIIFDFDETALEINISYDGRIPLNPNDTPEYEVSEADTTIDSLWLHLIKKRMDRVFFKIDGPRKVLQLIKYKRPEEKVRQLWFLELKPKLTAGAEIEIAPDQRENEFPEKGIIQNIQRGTILQLDRRSIFVLSRLDGQTSLNEIYLEHAEKIGFMSPYWLASLYQALEDTGMIESLRQTTSQDTGFFRKLLKADFSIGKADGVISALYPPLRFLFHPLTVILLLLVGISGIIHSYHHFDLLLSSAIHVDTYFVRNPSAALILYGILFFNIVVHECAHALACKHYGGKIRRMGMMFYISAFIFYCDTSSAWNFPKKHQRIFVSMAGPLATFVAFGIALWFTGGRYGQYWDGIINYTGIICGLGLIMNFNPLLKMDAYYMLVDLIDCPNLQALSFQFLNEKIRSIFGRSASKAPKPVERLKLIYWVYGIFGAFMTAVFIIWPLVHYSHILLFEKGVSGRIAYAVLVVMLILLRLGIAAFRKIQRQHYREYKII